VRKAKIKSFLSFGTTSEEGVSKAVCLLPEPKPSSVEPVVVVVTALLLAIKNDKEDSGLKHAQPESIMIKSHLVIG
jgi:hypothetical protein